MRFATYPKWDNSPSATARCSEASHRERGGLFPHGGLRLLPGQFVQLPGLEVLVRAEGKVEGVLALVGVLVPPGVNFWIFSSPGHPGANSEYSSQRSAAERNVARASSSTVLNELYEGTCRKLYSRTMRENLSRRNIRAREASQDKQPS